MKCKNLSVQTLKSLARDWGIDYQTYRIKAELTDIIRSYCEDRGISQRKLAKMVVGLTQDRVSKIFSGQVGHMTLDKLVAIMSALGMKVTLVSKAA